MSTSIDSTVKSIEIIDKSLSFESATKKLYRLAKKESGFKGNINDAVEREKFFDTYEVVPVYNGQEIVGIKLNYSLKGAENPEKKSSERKPASGCGPVKEYIFG